eukprot:CAMPEP_0184859434 /NCGR_PEP_ID=MMETSP0580-20130426/4439_1 /TAXON_ID=1118495 /ORGANISM="Dactyliosolen fragilissimus" /LENGTH=342 /DNA_ID=CAMNT_0027356065 /DNA_START=162 /DNA_END=1190 /DNA_ORIENTATION=+
MYWTNEQQQYMKDRRLHFDSWHNNSTGKLMLNPNADENGPILDFAVIGYPKCGTTTLMANLGYLAPMSIADICTPVHQTVWYSYKNWPKQFGQEKLMRGTKCPQYLSLTPQSSLLIEYSKHLPKTKLIAGIRHPIKWFESFWNMQCGRGIANPYNKTKLCIGNNCSRSCPRGQIFCLHRARMHLALAGLGKTNLSKEERQLLAPNDPDGGDNLKFYNIKNSVFLYDQEQLVKDNLWESLAQYLGVSHIPHDLYEGSHGRGGKKKTCIDFCNEQYDLFRSMMMPYAYEMSVWLQDYFIPVAKNENRPDVVISSDDSLFELVESYKNDPCGRLIRLVNGTYVLP